MTDSEATISSRRHISGIWLVPVVAVVLGIYLLYQALSSQGPIVHIHFDTAEGLEVDKTAIKFRNVTLGKVSAINLDEDFEGVRVTAAMTPESRPLLRDDTDFWVVRPRITSAGVSGLSTLVSGAYIELGPGALAATENYEFTGLTEIPVTSAGTPGLRVRLISDTSGELKAGDPVLYMGYRVGVVETAKLDIDDQQMHYSAFIEAPYDGLVSSTTRFWNASGISAQFNSEGIKLSVGSLQTVMMGGVAFGLPNNAEPGRAVRRDTRFALYANEASIHQNPNKYAQHYVVHFSQSLRGLNPGAEVTFRGIRIGSVVKVMLTELVQLDDNGGGDRPMPVLLRIEPGALTIGDTPEAIEDLKASIVKAVNRGLRASLVSGNLLTGALYVDLNYYPDEPPEGIGKFQGYPVVPSVAGGFGQIQHQIVQLLKKANGLPLEQTVGNTNAAVAELRGTLVQLRQLLASDGTRNLPVTLNQTLNELNSTLRHLSGSAGFTDNLNRSLVELNQTLRSLQKLTEALEEKPNSIIFPVKHGEDPIPRAGKK